ncbi:hypothetical protein LSUB1_G003371 [Lachnellula subtilissima]|uniref:Rhodopsin domain-containing protein n=1 Tax=Lachnellula subtilissima TaxID=602034 RepID=A0A8H8UB05_9HELO|nr:hypothetical protein LSUB1_G003371 [Lachnellula subtilissima]
MPNAAKYYRAPIIVSIAIMNVWTLVTWFYVLFQCRPVSYAWDMSIQMKASLLVILGLGVFASISIIIRFKYTTAFGDRDDSLYSIEQTLLWTSTELGIGILTASFATLRPLVGHFHIRGFSSGSRDRSNRPTVRSGYFQSYDLGYIQNTANAGKTTRRHMGGQ